MSAPLLATKINFPIPRLNLVVRRRLIDKLDQSLMCKLTIISAPAGFGKTTLLSGWVRERAISAAWLSLDEDDRDPYRFLAYSITALRTIMPGLGESILEDLKNPRPKSIEQYLIVLINEIVGLATDHFVFILDDYHLVDALPIQDMINFLLDNQPRYMHLVIATRADPSLSIARLRGRGDLVELRQGDLQFNPAEASEFLNHSMGLELVPEQISALAARTEGWIAGLQMAAVSMQGRHDLSSFIQSFTGTHRHILDYLMEEVLDHQPEHIQEFLLQTSILDRFTSNLCETVTGQSESHSAVDYLEHANLFVVPLDDDRHWYRYHHLFADLLQKQLMQKKPELIPGLHQKASAWFHEQGFPEDAIMHALAARDYDFAAHILERNITLMMGRGEMSLIEKFFGRLPEGIIHAHPILSVRRIWGLTLSGRLDEAERKILEIDDQPETTDNKDFSGNIALIRALMADIRGDKDTAIALANRADDLLSADDTMVRSMIPYILGNGYLASGDLEKAEQAFEQIKRIGITTNNLWTKTVAYHRLAQLKKLRGRLKEAQALCEEFLEIAGIRGEERYGFFCEIYFELGDLLREFNNLEAAREMVTQALEHMASWWVPADLVIGYTTLARICLAQADLEGAGNAIRKAQSVSRQSNIFRIIRNKLDASQVQLWLRQGNLFEASQWAHEIEVELNTAYQDEQIDFANEVNFITLARVWIAKGTNEQNRYHFDRANHLLSILARFAQDGQRFDRLIEILALQAIVLDRQGDEKRALEVLESCLSSAQPGGYLRVFLDGGPAMQHLLHQAKRNRISFSHTERLLDAFDENVISERIESPKLVRAAFVEPLSDREMEVLMLLPSGLTAAEMAEKLIIAKSTIDTHIKHIYSKLGVNRRMEAIRRAKELDLL